MNKLVSILSCFALTAMLCVPVAQAAYPDHPVKLMTMTGPGAQIDLVTRALADKFKDYLDDKEEEALFGEIFED